MKRPLGIFLFWVSVFSSVSLFAEAVPEAANDESAYSAVLYDNRNGLPTSEANAIVETEDGFIWVGSYSGLIRYDGAHFERIDSSTGIASVISLYVDSQKRLWVGTNDGGVAVQEDMSFRLYGKDDGLKSLSVHSIVEAEDGLIYLATTQGVALIDESMQLRLVDAPEINESYVRCLRAGQGGVVYGLTKAGELFTMVAGKLTGFYSSATLGLSGIRAIQPDPGRHGFLYLGSSASEIYYGKLGVNFDKIQTIETEPLSYINSLRFVGDRLWVCADTGIGWLEDGELFYAEKLPLSTSVEDAMSDYQGNLWFVSSQQGLMKIVPNQFVNVFERYQIEEDVITTTCVYGDKLFIGSKNKGLQVLYDGKLLESLPLREFHPASKKENHPDDLLEMLADSRIRSIIRDSRNRLWISCFGDEGLLCYDDGVVTQFSKANGMPSNRIRAVYERDDGSIMVSCTGGLAIIEGTSVCKVYGEKSGIANEEVLTAAQMIGGEMVIGTDGGGIYVIKGDSVVHIGIDEGLSSEVVMRIKPSLSKNILWVVTGNSIAYMTPDSHVHTVKNFPYSNNFDVYENGLGDLWVLSSNGIYIANIEQLLENDSLTPLYYGMGNGLPCIATANSYSGMSDDWDLYIAGTTGVSKVNLRKSFESFDDLKMVVPFVKCDSSFIYPEKDGSFILSSSVKKLTVYSYVCSYSLMDPQVTYQLQAFDPDVGLVKRSELSPVSYTNLKGGEYHFILQLLDSHGNACKRLVVPIVKQKAFFEFAWVRILFVFLVLLFFFLGGMLYVEGRTRRLLKKERKQRRLTREIVEAFAKVIDMKDRYTNGHSSRVAEYTQMLARELGYDEDTVEDYYNIALLHDIGKIGIPSEILNKPGKLTESEFNTIKSHSALGYEALKDISIMPELAIGAGAHHERPDGRGYPKGLEGDEIPRVAQIISVADTFDAMYSDRPYRKRMNFDAAVSIMKEVSGSQLAPDVVDAFLRLVERGEFKAADDHGGGTTEDINNIRRKFDGKSL